MKIVGRMPLAAAASMALVGVASAAPAMDARTFTVEINNISDETTLHLADGTSARVPIAPGAYAIVEAGTQLFVNGGKAGVALERLAEDGSPEAFVAKLKKMKGVRAAGQFHDEPITVTVKPGERLVFAAMFAQSNDLFYAPDPKGIDLFDSAGQPRTGSLTDPITLWDAGTEVNEAPGLGPNQAPRQAKPNTGPTENGAIRPVNDGFTYPAANKVLELSITAN